VLREHVGPFLFSLTALTSLLLLNFISRQLGELVGKGLPKEAIGEFFLLSIPFTLALTLPMSVLVAVLYAFSRLAAENEITALKASGVSPWRVVAPSIGAGIALTLFLLAFNDQVLPRANHQLKSLQDDIAQTKPTFLLKPQVINAISEGKLYLKAGKIDRAGSRLTEVVIYDLGDQTRRRTIYADSGSIAFAPNMRDLDMELYDGEIEQVSTEKASQLNRLFYARDRIRVKDVAGSFSQSKRDSTSRGERELGICAMQRRLHAAEAVYRTAKHEHDWAVSIAKKPPRTDGPTVVPPFLKQVTEPHGIGWAYCSLVTRLIGVKAAQAADLRGLRGTVGSPAQDTTPKAVRDSIARKARLDSIAQRAAQDSAAARAAARVAGPGGGPMVFIGGQPANPQAGQAAPVPGAVIPGQAPPAPVTVPGMPPQSGTVILGATPNSTAVAAPMPTRAGGPAGFATPEQVAAAAMAARGAAESNTATFISRTAEAKLRLDIAEKQRNRYEIEIHKKFSLAAACLIFVILGAPIALRFPRGGVGLVIGVSLLVFAIYYVGLIGGEALANKGLMPPFWAMWGANVILTAVGIVLLFRMGRESNTARGGDWGDRMDTLRGMIRRRRPAKSSRTAE
jgi:lipopolysaccharide export system permease protein